MTNLDDLKKGSKIMIKPRVKGLSKNKGSFIEYISSFEAYLLNIYKDKKEIEIIDPSEENDTLIYSIKDIF